MSRTADSLEHGQKDRSGGYDNWCAITSFFDGDGSPQNDILAIKLEFVDNWLPQIIQLRAFIVSQGIRTGKIRKGMGRAYVFVLASQSGVLKAAERVLEARGCVYKKRDELNWVVQYLKDEITATDFIENLNEEVRDGNRVGKIRRIDIPFRHSEGSRQRYVRLAERMRLLTDEQKRQIVIDRGMGKMTLAGLAKKYGVSITTIARALGQRKK